MFFRENKIEDLCINCFRFEKLKIINSRLDA